MSELVIIGGKPLWGELKVQGSKNSALPLLAATIVTSGKTTLHNCPQLQDVETAIEILRILGCNVKREGSCVTVDSRNVNCGYIPDKLMRKMRSSVVFLGAILARLRRGELYMPGGCRLGPRPIDIHLSSFQRMGVVFEENAGKISCDGKNMAACDISLSFPSVGATENIMLAACGCNGRTTIRNAAREPEIVDLQAYLRAVGYDVSGAGESIITIEGSRCIKRTDVIHRVIPDRIAAGTYLCAAAATGGKITLHNTYPAHYIPLCDKLRELGCVVDCKEFSVSLSSNGNLKGISSVQTMPYPAFPTDLQSPLMAVSCFGRDTSVFVENIFDARYQHVPELVRMGARIDVIGRVAIVFGGNMLTGTQMTATDLRGGAALAVAALGANGKSRISATEHIERGYERFDEALSKLGGDVRRI